MTHKIRKKLEISHLEESAVLSEEAWRQQGFSPIKANILSNLKGAQA
jgi:hypothetical protein